MSFESLERRTAAQERGLLETALKIGGLARAMGYPDEDVENACAQIGLNEQQTRGVMQRLNARWN